MGRHTSECFDDVINFLQSEVHGCAFFSVVSRCILPWKYPATMIAIANRKQTTSDNTRGIVGLVV